MIRNRNIVVFGLQPWDIEIGSNCKNIALELAKNNKVLYINRPLDRITWLRKKKNTIAQNRMDVLTRKKSPLVQLDTNFWILTPPVVMESVQWLNSSFLFKFFNRWNNRKLAKTVKRYLEKLGFNDFILFNDSAMFQGNNLKEFLSPELFIYYIRDYLIAQPYFEKHGPNAEKRLVEQADLVVANSTYLVNYAKVYNSNSFYIGQGCDLEEFQPQEIHSVPAALKKLSGPIIGYVGNLTSKRLDLEILIYLAKRNPSWSIVLVGGEDNVFKKSVLHNFDNVHFLGFQKPETLPQFIHGFDVCINPQVLNQLSIGNYPRKIDEYLAMGKPVVATRTEGMIMFEDYVCLAEDKYQFEADIRYLLKTDCEALRMQRINFAKSHTWENSVRALENALVNKIA
ncbi:glycosyltransferase [Aureispira anguillae]|uniref:Glycosyltransferase n=1 Tax=Aureispira anguillae TaxID=2864201 RepID=A0A915YM88_9BACT|nr:glycosyltransferase [Aureispira anguillae]BDS15547.1 glycosyltransferase [Aureispira anguillae]